MLNHCVALVLAAGKASRMGKAKQLLPIHKKTLLAHCLENIKSARITNVICVLGARADKIRDIVKVENVIFITNENWAEGLSTSIQKGVEYILKNKKKCDTILITLADQPMVDATYLNLLIQENHKNPNFIIASQYDNGFGVPALFPKTCFSDLLMLKGDKGARKYLYSNMEKVVVLPKSRKLLDIDTNEQYDEYLIRSNKEHKK